MEFKNMCINGISYGDKKNLKNSAKFPKVSNVDFLDMSLINALYDA